MIRPKIESRVREVAPRFPNERSREINRAPRSSKVEYVDPGTVETVSEDAPDEVETP